MTNQKGAIGERGWTDGRTSQVSVRMPSAGCHISRQVPSATSNGLVACPRMGFAPSRSFPNEPCSDSWGLTRSHVVFADLHTVLVNAVLVLFRVPQPKPQDLYRVPCLSAMSRRLDVKGVMRRALKRSHSSSSPARTENEKDLP